MRAARRTATRSLLNAAASPVTVSAPRGDATLTRGQQPAEPVVTGYRIRTRTVARLKIKTRGAEWYFFGWLRAAARPSGNAGARPGRTECLTVCAAPTLRDDTSTQVAVSDGLPKLEALKHRHGAGAPTVAGRILTAVFLHRSGRKEQAWAAFEELLRDPELGGAASVRPILHSEIYSRMRMCFEREGCFNAAVTPAVLSYVARAQFYALQGRQRELETLRAAACFDRHFLPFLQRARLEHASRTLRRLTDKHLNELPMLNTIALKVALEELRQSAPSPPPRPAPSSHLTVVSGKPSRGFSRHRSGKYSPLSEAAHAGVTDY